MRSGTKVISAEVVLQPASGKSFRDLPPPESGNIAEHLPSQKAAEAARAVFRELGFDVGPLRGISFPITAPSDLFNRVFRTSVELQPNGAIMSVRAPGAASYELPLDALPRDATREIAAVTFTPPPDFGPTRFGP